MSHLLSYFSILILLCTLFSCEPAQTDEKTTEMSTSSIDQSSNDLAAITSSQLGNFQWMNAPTDFSIEAGQLVVTAKKGSDFFNNPENGDRTATAPLLYREVSGDFVATAYLRPDFSSMWNAACLMMHADSTHWIKLAFENSDATGKSVVTVVTNEVSDDANGVRLPNQ